MDAVSQNLLQASLPISSTYPLHVYNQPAQQQPNNSLQVDQEILRTAAAADGVHTVAVTMAVDEAPAAGLASAAEEGEQSIRSLSQAAEFHNHTQNRQLLHQHQNPTDSRDVHSSDGGGMVSGGAGGVCSIKKVVRYKECRKNQAATMGGYAIDGCGEFMPSSSNQDGTLGLQCAACHCHRNFHRREVDGEKPPAHCQHTRR